MQRNTELRYAYLDPEHPAVVDLPQIVNEEYHSLYPLDESAVSKTLGLNTVRTNTSHHYPRLACDF